MGNTVTLVDYSIEKGVFKGCIRVDNASATLPEIIIKNIRLEEKWEDISVNCIDEGMFRFEVDMNCSDISTGTWYPLVYVDGLECRMQYKGMTNRKNVGRMTELSESKLYFDSENKIHYMGALDRDSFFVIRKWRDGNEGISKSAVYIKKFSVDNNRITFVLNKCFDKEIEQAEIWVWNKVLKLTGRAAIDDIKEGKETFTVDKSVFDIVKQTDCDKVWEVYLVMNYNGTYRQGRMEVRGKGFLSKANIRKSIADESERFIISEPVCSGDDNCDKVYQLYFNKLARLCCKVVPENMQYKERYRGEATDINVKKGKLCISALLGLDGFEDTNLLLRSCNEITGESHEYEFEKDKEWFSLECSKVLWNEADKYEITLLASKEQCRYEFRVIRGSSVFLNKLAGVYRYCYKTEDNHLIYFSETIGGKVTIEYREWNRYDSLKYRINEKIALMLFKSKATRLFSKNKSILLFYEKFCTAAQDNSFMMFEYFAKKNDNGVVPRYVLEKKAPDYKALRRKYGMKIVPFMSIRHLIELQMVRMFVSTDSKRHCYRWHGGSTMLSRVIEDKPFVFLQHGVLGLKKVDYIYSSQFANKASMFITSSEFERDIVERYFGYNRNEIAITGLARWDMLEDNSEGERLIFYMPTWRNWILETDTAEFIKTDYYKACNEIINSERLNGILEKNDARMVFCLHPKFRQYSKEMNSRFDRISIVDFADCKINELIMKCRMFITDYSSAAWDAFYMEKPVLFYQFDVEKYLETQGTYINFDNGLFGERVTEFDDFLENIDRIASGDFKENSCNKELRDKYLPVRDKNNRKRIYDNIMAKLQ